MIKTGSKTFSDLQGRGVSGRMFLPLRDSTPFRHKGSPLCTILRNPYLFENPKNYSKSPSASIYTNFEGGARAKKNAFFLIKIFQKVPKNAFKRRNLDQNKVFFYLEELRKSIWSTYKKGRRQSFRKKILDPPLVI